MYVWNGRFFEPHVRVETHRPTILGSLAWTVWWAWVPSLYAAVMFHAVTTAGTAPINESQFVAAFIPAMCLFWCFVHWLRWLGRRPK
jgi:hypothetical protein